MNDKRGLATANPYRTAAHVDPLPPVEPEQWVWTDFAHGQCCCLCDSRVRPRLMKCATRTRVLCNICRRQNEELK